MAKRGESVPRNNEQNDNRVDKQYGDAWLNWISRREDEIKKSDRADSEKAEYHKMLEGLWNYRKEHLASERGYEIARERDRKNIDTKLDEVINYINKQAKNDPNTTKADVDTRIAERRMEHREALREMEAYEEWLRRNRYRTEAQAWDDQHSPQSRKAYGFSSETKEPAVYFRQEQETRHDYNQRIAKNDSMAVIAQFIPKIEGQTANEYSKLIAKIYDQSFPRKTSENGADYEQRIKTAFEKGDFQVAVADALIDSQSEADQAADLILTQIENYDKELAQNPDMGLDQRVKQLKKKILELAISSEQQEKAKEAEEAKSLHREDLRIRLTMQKVKEEKARRIRARFRRLGRIAMWPLAKAPKSAPITTPKVNGSIKEDSKNEPREKVSNKYRARKAPKLTPNTDGWFNLKSHDKPQEIEEIGVVAMVKPTKPTPNTGDSAKENHDKLQEEEAIAMISELIPSIDGQTTEERNQLIKKIYNSFALDVDLQKNIETFNDGVFRDEGRPANYHAMNLFYIGAGNLILNPQSPPTAITATPPSSVEFSRKYLRAINGKRKEIARAKMTESERSQMLVQARKEVFKSLIEEELKSKQTT